MKKSRDVDAYIKQFSKDIQSILTKVRNTIQEAALATEEAMVYKIPTFKLDGKNLVHFAGHAKHIGFYPTPSGIEKFKKEISKYKSSKGSVQFPLDEPIAYELIKKMTKFRLKELTTA